MIDHKVFVDSNILVYLIDSRSKDKTKKVQDFLSPNFLISTQVIAENVNVCLKKLNLSKEKAFDFGKRLMKRFVMVQITEDILLRSFDISVKYQLSAWDSIIVATALLNGCDLLYSEDMQNGLTVDGSLTISNPFTKPSEFDPHKLISF